MTSNNAQQQHRVNYERVLKAVRTIQSHWRGYVIRKLYRDLRVDMATKAMQFGYFCEQVVPSCLLSAMRLIFGIVLFHPDRAPQQRGLHVHDQV